MGIITQKGKLPFGIDLDGVPQCDFEIRPRLVKDTMEIAREQGMKKLEDDDIFFTLCLTAKQIIHIGDIQPVPVEVILEMMDEDMGAILKAKENLATRLESFRASSEGGGGQGASDVATAANTPDEKDHPGAVEDTASDG